MEEGIKNINNSKNKTFIAFCFCFVMGVSFLSLLDFKRDYLFELYISVFIILFFIIIFWNSKKYRFIFFCILFFVLGGARYLIFLPKIDENNIAHYNNQEIEFVGRVLSEPDIRIGKGYYILSDLDVDSKKLSGKVRISMQLYPQYEYGDVLKVKCKLQIPEAFQSFRYDKYLAMQGVGSICYYPVILSVSEESKDQDDSGSVQDIFLENIFKFKNIIAGRINLLWSEPGASFMGGILYGARGGFDENLTENFNKTGLTHIIAISGYNISIVVAVLMVFLIYVGFYRQSAFYLTLLGIFLFVIFAGASASVVRAGVMGSLVLLAQYLGRRSQIFGVLILTCVLMVLYNPFILIWDAGFQLSFLATVGIIYFTPIMNNFLFKNKFLNSLNFFKIIKNTLSPTLSAILFTLPLIMFQFGRVSLVSPFTNLLILWIIPILMLLGFLSVVLSFVFYPFGLVLSWFSYVGMSYVILLVKIFSGWSLSSVQVVFPLGLMIISYILLFYLISKNMSKKKIKVYNSKEGYDLAAKFYDKKEKYLDSFEKDRLIPLIGEVKDKKVLDVGAGTGRLSLRLSKEGAQVTALDTSPEMLLILNQKNKNIETVVGDAESLPFADSSFDVVVASFLIVHLKNLDSFFNEVYRVLKDGGIFLLTNINQKEAPLVKTEAGEIKIESFYHRPEEVREKLEQLAFQIEDEVFVKEGDLWVDQILKCRK